MKKTYLVNSPIHNGTEVQADGEIEMSEKDAAPLVARGTLSEKPVADKPEAAADKKIREKAEKEAADKAAESNIGDNA